MFRLYPEGGAAAHSQTAANNQLTSHVEVWMLEQDNEMIDSEHIFKRGVGGGANRLLYVEDELHF